MDSLTIRRVSVWPDSLAPDRGVFAHARDWAERRRRTLGTVSHYGSRQVVLTQWPTFKDHNCGSSKVPVGSFSENTVTPSQRSAISSCDGALRELVAHPAYLVEMSPNGSVTASANSCAAAIDNPAAGPSPAEHLLIVAIWYGTTITGR